MPILKKGIQGESKKDFIHKFSISQKESFETLYWLRLLKDSGYLKKEKAENLIDSCKELQRIITAIIKTTKKSISRKQFTIKHLQFTIKHLQFTIKHLQFTIKHLQFTINHL